MKKIIVGLVFMLFSLSGLTEIYKWVDEKGKVHFGDKKPQKQKTQTVQVEINTFTTVSFDFSVFDTGEQVVMYSTSWCGYCKQARNYFKANRIDFVEYDIEKNASARKAYDKLGGAGVPVILKGKQRMNGFTEEGFKRMQ